MDIAKETLAIWLQNLHHPGALLSRASSEELLSAALILLAFILFLLFVFLLCLRSLSLFLLNVSENAAGGNFSRTFSATENVSVEEAEKSQENISEQEQQAIPEEADGNDETPLPENIARARKKEKNLIEPDWKRDRKAPQKIRTNSDEISYKKEAASLGELTGLIAELITRGVDENKIAQSINYRNQGKAAEEDILQTVHAIRSFMEMVWDGMFDSMKNIPGCPTPQEAVFYLSYGDVSPALALLQAKMDVDTERALFAEETKKEERLADVSETALLYGNLATTINDELSLNAYKLAFELKPDNFQAQSRLADLYFRQNKKDKALKIYNQLLSSQSMPELAANAKLKKARCLELAGKKEEAVRLNLEAAAYYEQTGIRHPLSPQEIDVLNIIESIPALPQAAGITPETKQNERPVRYPSAQVRQF